MGLYNGSDWRLSPMQNKFLFFAKIIIIVLINSFARQWKNLINIWLYSCYNIECYLITIIKCVRFDSVKLS